MRSTCLSVNRLVMLLNGADVADEEAGFPCVLLTNTEPQTIVGGAGFLDVVERVFVRHLCRRCS